MIPNIHIHEKLMLERHQEVLHEMEQRRMLKGVQRQPFSMPRQLVGKLGVLLIALGTSWQRFEPNRESIG
ncbi:MAG TPA: hypothetical protein DDW33_06990 [Ktedonobacter sp.]|jgi:hypothetical protein|nr:hypothetical protein [Ktedonobacter sp.]HBE25414.1 hypothetical protein [Ktedonobacter sp.]HCJ33267.1 hypothetical protein [Ktedonobacter sp.]HCP75150.1 hypothetical protein [Ktedonobacter sp.]